MAVALQLVTVRSHPRHPSGPSGTLTRMRRTVAVLATVLLAAGCSAATTSPPKTPASSSPTVDQQAQFLRAVHDANLTSWAVHSPTDADILAYPGRWCAALDAGHSASYILNTGEGLYPVGNTWGTKKTDATQLLVLAVTNYCPAHRATVIQQLQADGDW